MVGVSSKKKLCKNDLLAGGVYERECSLKRSAKISKRFLIKNRVKARARGQHPFSLIKFKRWMEKKHQPTIFINFAERLLEVLHKFQEKTSSMNSLSELADWAEFWPRSYLSLSQKPFHQSKYAHQLSHSNRKASQAICPSPFIQSKKVTHQFAEVHS